MTLVSDLDRGVVDYVGDGRTKECLDEYFQSRTEEQRQAIEAVAMDMWEPFILSVKGNLENGEELIVFDPFHIVQHMTAAKMATRVPYSGKDGFAYPRQVLESFPALKAWAFKWSSILGRWKAPNVPGVTPALWPEGTTFTDPTIGWR